MLKRLTNSKMKSSVNQYIISFINSSIPLTLFRLQKTQTMMIGKMYLISNLARLSVSTDGRTLGQRSIKKCSPCLMKQGFYCLMLPPHCACVKIQKTTKLYFVLSSNLDPESKTLNIIS